jgi:hypothetical protein
MQRVLLLLLLLAPACARREVASGEWTGVARPDASLSVPGPTRDPGEMGGKGVDTSGPAPDAAAGAPGAELAPPDAAAGGRAVEVGPPASDPVLSRADASADVGDARACPESGQCD